MLNPGEEDCRS